MSWFVGGVSKRMKAATKTCRRRPSRKEIITDKTGADSASVLMLNFNFGKMTSPRDHATSTQSMGPRESLRQFRSTQARDGRPR